jgi:hypothetical protein
MHLSKLLNTIPFELTRLHSAYEAAAPAHPCLAPYPTLPALLACLRRTRGPSTPTRKALVASLVRIHQTFPHPVWSTILIHVFTPPIKKLRKELRGSDQETRDEIIVVAFHEGLVDVRTDDPQRIFMYVRQGLRRRVFKALEEVAAWEEVGFGVDADLVPDPTTLSEPPLIRSWLRCRGAGPQKMELLETLVDRGGLQRLILKRYPDLDEAGQARALWCLHKRRQRLVGELRRQLRAEMVT